VRGVPVYAGLVKHSGALEIETIVPDAAVH
jgi:hypothetical protein